MYWRCVSLDMHVVPANVTLVVRKAVQALPGEDRILEERDSFRSLGWSARVSGNWAGYPVPTGPVGKHDFSCFVFGGLTSLVHVHPLLSTFLLDATLP